MRTPDVNQCAAEATEPNLVPEALSVSKNSQDKSEPRGIFVYGTLMAKELSSWILTGPSENCKIILRQPAVLKHYRRVPLKNDDYPAVVAGTMSDQVEGLLISPISSGQWEKLDDFEGDEYRRDSVSVYLRDTGTLVAAQVYVWNGDMDDLELESAWDYAYFREHRLKAWLDLYNIMEKVG
jgi:gamma-glutamylcyclotransferase (GGCT)/AIG2-like uncharacterized protein YtfP